VVPGDMGPPFVGAGMADALFVVPPMFFTGWHRSGLDEGSIRRNLCLQAPCSDVGSTESKSTDHPRRSPTTSSAVVRRVGSCCQQLDVMFHTGSVRPSFRAPSGRAGRPPPTIFKTMDGVLELLNG